MPIALNFIERTLMLRLNQAPAPTLDMYGAVANRAVSTALKFGIFEVLRDGGLTRAQVADKLDANERGIGLLLDALEALGYLEMQDGRYANSVMTKKWMLADAPQSIAHLFSFFDTVIERCGHLEETIRTGKPPIFGWEWFNQHPGTWERYYAGMLDGARLACDEVVSKVELPPTARRLIDVGGGHGLYSIKFCQKHPQLSATVFDWPQALETAKATIAAENMGTRVSLQEGDLWSDDLGSGYDLALVFNMVHMYTREKNAELIQRVAETLEPGGLLVIMDQIAIKGRGSAAKAIARLQGLQLFNSVMGQTYSFEEIGDWLTNARFHHVQTSLLRRAPSSGLVVGVKGR
ncbi:MAG: methyltransferase [Anaerolineales bacterium]